MAQQALAQVLFEAGVDGVNFYNYGLIPAKRLDWVGETVAAISR